MRENNDGNTDMYAHKGGRESEGVETSNIRRKYL